VNSSRVYLDRFAIAAGSATPAGGRVLDAGAGEGQYRHHFDHADYEAADFEAVPGKTYSGNNYVCDLAAIPVEDDRFDTVLFSQVLEHLPEPVAVLVELRRVLRPGGLIFATAPLFYEEHEQPYDFYRYTQFGLRHLFETAGFQELQIEWLEGYLGTVSYQLDVFARAVEGTNRWRRGAPIFRRLSAASARADVRKKITNLGHPKNYTVIATA
jgi:ubiquinone/menaquinone biosynthesis C-methylase UbiE